MARKVFNRQCEYVQAGFSATGTDLQITFFVDGGGPHTITLTGSFFYSSSGSCGSDTYYSFTGELQSRIVNLEGVTIETVYNPVSGNLYVYTDGGSIVVDLDSTTTAGKQLMGLSLTDTGWVSGSTVPAYTGDLGGPYTLAITGSAVPYYVWRSRFPARQKWVKPYEAESISIDGVATDGTTISINREGPYRFSEWQWGFEEEDHLLAAKAQTIEPWTWQHFIRHVRAYVPWTVHTSSAANGVNPSWVTKEGVFKLQAEGANFKPEPSADKGYLDHQTVMIKAKLLGSGSANGSFA